MMTPTPVALHTVVDGPEQAPPLLLLPSLGTTVDLWQPQLEALSARYRVIRVDHRGHGGSPVPTGPYHLADLGADARAVLDRLGIDRAHVAGVSLGGMVAMWLAAHHPQRVDRLLPICTSAKIEPESMWRDRAAAVRAGGLGSIADAVVARWIPPATAAARPDLVARARAMLAAVPDEGYAACCAALETMDLAPDLGRIAAPTLVIAGADDLATPPSHAERIAAGIPGGRTAVVPGAHLANLSHPEPVTRLMLRFLGGDDDG
jgi:3-oxoadipate enol-lactonase